MNELLRKRIKNEVIEKLKNQGYSYEPFENIINVYVDIKIQEPILEQRIKEYKGSNQGKKVLLQVLDKLKEDIKSYEEKLLLD